MLNPRSYSYATVTALWRVVHLVVWCSGVSVVSGALPLGFMSSMMCLGLRLRLPLPLQKGRVTVMQSRSPPAICFEHCIIDPDVQGA